MQWKGLYKERNPFKKMDEHSIEREREREREREKIVSYCENISLDC